MYKIYEVNYNESLSDIVNKLGVPIDVIYELNGKINSVYPGMRIIIPNTDETPYIKHVVQKGENVYSISNKYGVNYKEILALNGLNGEDYIYPNQELIILNNNFSTYVTNNNDTIESIVKKIGQNISNILKYNTNLYLEPGQIIVYKKEKSI